MIGGLLRLFFRADSQASVRKKRRGYRLLLPAPPRADAGAQVPKRSGRYDGHGEARRTGLPAGIAGAVGVSSKLRNVEVVMGCSTLIGGLSVAGSGQHRRARRRRGDSAWLSPRAPLAGRFLRAAVLRPAPGPAVSGGLVASFGLGGIAHTGFARAATGLAISPQG